MSDAQTQDRSFDTLEKRLDHLPVLPILVSRLVTLDLTDEGAFDEIVELAEEEPTFALRILSLANSVLLAPAEEITTLHQAVSRIGSWRVAELCASMAVLRIFFPQNSDDRALWVHALQTAVGARRIAGAAEGKGVDAQEAYLLGLLHDFGRLVLSEIAPDELRRVDEVGFSSPELLVLIERQLLGFSHAEFGARAAEHWGLPAQLAGLIRHHHEYCGREQLAQLVDDPDLLQVVQMADFLSVHMLLSPENFADDSVVSAESVAHCLHKAWSPAPIDAQSLAELAVEIRREADTLIEGLGL